MSQDKQEAPISTDGTVTLMMTKTTVKVDGTSRIKLTGKDRPARDQ